ncbi:Region found in RelA / SpoT proteins [uncultured archaeon]|nr:Region found in RelA / SpoT proteins [uncultured archaeon]
MDNIDLDLVRKQFLERSSIYKRLEEEAIFIIQQALNNTDIKIYSIQSRVKDVDSFLDKSRRKQCRNPIEEIKDIVGLRIVCLFLSDITRISDIIRKSFDAIEEDNKIDSSEATLFGYLSMHFIVKLKDDCSGPRYQALKGLSFEIQIRTLTMDAWANVSHYLDYKSEVDIPGELKRDFYALSGLFYVSDTHFEMFFKSRQNVTQRLEESELLPTQEINLDSLKIYLNKKFPEREHLSNPSDISELVDELIKNRYNSIGKLEDALAVSNDAFLAYEKENRGPNYYADLGAVRISLSIYDDNFRRGHGLTKSEKRAL